MVMDTLLLYARFYSLDSLKINANWRTNVLYLIALRTTECTWILLRFKKNVFQKHAHISLTCILQCNLVVAI